MDHSWRPLEKTITARKVNLLQISSFGIPNPFLCSLNLQKYVPYFSEEFASIQTLPQFKCIREQCRMEEGNTHSAIDL